MAKHMSRKEKKFYRVLCVLVLLILLALGLYGLSKWIGNLFGQNATSSEPSSSFGLSSGMDSSDNGSSEFVSSEILPSSEPVSSQLPASSPEPVSSPVPVSSPAPSSQTPVSSPTPASSQPGSSKPNTGIYANVTWRSPYAEYADIMKHGRNLMLLNNYYELPLDFEWDLVYWSNGQSVDAMSLNSKEYDKVQAVDRAAYQPLKDLFAAAKAAGVPLQMVSAFRSISLQDRLFGNLVTSYLNNGLSREAAIKKANTARTFTGTSEHNTGLGFDILESGNWYLSQSFENTAQFKWLQEHAADYGFILRYDKTKVDITGIMYEPWHYRYVGVEAAKEIKESGMCLEEYIEKLDRQG